MYVCMEAYSRSRNLHRNTRKTQTKAERTHIFDQFEWSLKQNQNKRFGFVCGCLSETTSNTHLWRQPKAIISYWKDLANNALHCSLLTATVNKPTPRLFEQQYTMHRNPFKRECIFFLLLRLCVCVLCARTSIETLNYFNSSGGEKVEKFLFYGLPRSFSHLHSVPRSTLNLVCPVISVTIYKNKITISQQTKKNKSNFFLICVFIFAILLFVTKKNWETIHYVCTICRLFLCTM